MDRPAAAEPRTVRAAGTDVAAPGLRQFLNRRAEVAVENSSPAAGQASSEGDSSWMNPVALGRILLAADAVVVTLSWVLLAAPGSRWVRALGCGGMVAGAALGVTGALLLVRRR